MAKEIYLSPAEVVIRSFGGMEKTALALGITGAAVRRWINPKVRKNQFGLIPAVMQKKIYIIAQESGIQISARDLVLGRTIGTKNVKG